MADEEAARAAVAPPGALTAAGGAQAIIGDEKDGNTNSEEKPRVRRRLRKRTYTLLKSLETSDRGRILVLL